MGKTADESILADSCGGETRLVAGSGGSIKTETNTYNWVEQDNHNQQIELTVGYMIKIK